MKIFSAYDRQSSRHDWQIIVHTQNEAHRDQVVAWQTANSTAWRQSHLAYQIAIRMTDCDDVSTLPMSLPKQTRLTLVALSE